MKEKRTETIHVGLTPTEYSVVCENVDKANVSSVSAYVRKMIFDGFIVNVDCSSLNEIVRLMKNISNNINQIARRINLNNSIYADDIEEIKNRQNELWNITNELLMRFGSAVYRE